MSSNGPRDIPDSAADLPVDPQAFWSVGPEFEALAHQLPPRGPEVLELLGPPTFPRTGFPFIGFLATVYDHVAEHVGRRAAGELPG